MKKRLLNAAVLVLLVILTPIKMWSETITVGDQTYTLFTGFTGTGVQEGNYTASHPNVNESHQKLVDGIKESKWCAVSKGSFSTVWTEFHYNKPICPKGYILTTGNDVENYPGRNPKNWTLKGKLNSSDAEWTTIATVTDDNTLPSKNTQDVQFLVDNNESFMFFRFEVPAIQGNNGNEYIMELGELQMFGTYDSTYEKNLVTASIRGSRMFYQYTGSPILIDYTVLNFAGATLQKGVDYTETYTKDGVETTVQETGEYTLTVTGLNDYTGLQTTTFTVMEPIPVEQGLTKMRGIYTVKG